MTDLWYTESHARDVKFSIQADRIIHSEQTPFHHIEFLHSESFGTFFTLDDVLTVAERDEFCRHEMLVHPAFAVNPAIKRVLILGGGDGGAAREVCRYKSVKQVDLVEHDRRVTELCIEYLPRTADILKEDPRIHLHFEDGTAFLADTAEKSYDLILVDFSAPVDAEFYEQCKRALVGDGILICPHGNPCCPGHAVKMVQSHRDLAGVFPLAQAYQVHLPARPSGSLLLGFASKGLHPVQDLNARSWEGLGLDTQYYNTELHRAAFSLPTYLKNLLSGEDERENA